MFISQRGSGERDEGRGQEEEQRRRSGTGCDSFGPSAHQIVWWAKNAHGSEIFVRIVFKQRRELRLLQPNKACQSHKGQRRGERQRKRFPHKEKQASPSFSDKSVWRFLS